MRTALCMLLAWLAWCASARADGAGVVLFERPGLRPSLCAALRIQLSGISTVRCQPEGEGDLLSARIEAGAAEVQQQGARLGVLLERDPDPTRVRMYLVARSASDALIAIESIEDRPEPDVDRSLALKVLDAHEVMGTATQARAPLAAALVPPAPVERAPASAHWHAFMEAGGGLSVAAHTRGLGNLLLGMARVAGPLRLELAAGVRLSTSLAARSAAGQVEVTQHGGWLGARLTRQRGRFVLGGALDLLISRFAAEGTTPAGKRGSEAHVLPALALAVDLRVRLFSSAHLRFAPGVELTFTEQRWAVDETVVLNQGRAALLLPLSLHLSLPLSRSAEGPPP